MSYSNVQTIIGVFSVLAAISFQVLQICNTFIDMFSLYGFGSQSVEIFQILF